MYWFDSCPKEKVDSIGELCIQMLGMSECECKPPTRQWIGGKSKVCLVRYLPLANAPPLLVQCWPTGDYKVPEVRKFLIKLVQVTGTSQIYEDHAKITKLDMALLR